MWLVLPYMGRRRARRIREVLDTAAFHKSGPRKVPEVVATADDFKEEAESWLRVSRWCALQDVAQQVDCTEPVKLSPLALGGSIPLARHSPEGIRLDEARPLKRVWLDTIRVRVPGLPLRKLSGMDEDTASKAAAANHRRGFDSHSFRFVAVLREVKPGCNPCTSVRLDQRLFGR